METVETVVNPIPDKVTDPSILARIEKLLTQPSIGTSKTFIESIRDFFKKRGYITGKQFAAFEKFENRFDPIVMAEQAVARANWESQYDEEKRNIAKICAQYYCQTSYFVDLAAKILKDPNFIPTEKQYRAMCENKYAKRLVENFTTQKYLPGQVVQTRNTKYQQTPKVGSIVCTVDKINRGSAKIGARIYTVLWMDSGEESQVFEKEIKLYRAKD